MASRECACAEYIAVYKETGVFPNTDLSGIDLDHEIPGLFFGGEPVTHRRMQERLLWVFEPMQRIARDLKSNEGQATDAPAA